MRDLVKKGYEEGKYDQFYGRAKHKFDALEKQLCVELITKTKPKGKILDLGCGVGLPYDKFFVKKGFFVTGIDLSDKHIALAKKNVPNAKYTQGDFFNTKGKYDAIVSFFAIFHIPRVEHSKLFSHIHSLLKKNGHILITLGAESMKYDVNKDFVGAPMAWSSYSIEKNKNLLTKAGFEILLAIEDVRTEHHLWILARKK